MKLISDTISMIIGSGAKQLLDFIYAVVLVRILSQLDYGTYKQADLLFQMLSVVAVFGFPLSLSYLLPTCKGDKSRISQYVLQTMFVMHILALIVMFCLIFGSHFFSIYYNNPLLVDYVRVYSIYAFFEIAIAFYPNYYLGTERARMLSGLSVLFSMLRLSCLLISIFLFNGRLQNVIILLSIYSIIKYIYLIIEILNHCKPLRWIFKSDLVANQLKYSVPTGIAEISGVVSKVIDKNMISSYFTPEKYALYVNGAIEVPFISVISGSVNSVLLPDFSKRYDCDNHNSCLSIIRTWNNAMIVTSSILVPIMFGLILYAKGFIRIVFTSSYDGSVPIFMIFLLVVPLRSINYGSLLMASGHQRKIMINAVVTVVICFALNMILIPMWGCIGAAIATVTSVYFMAILQTIQIMKIYAVKVSQIYRWHSLGIIYGSAGLICVCFYFLTRFIPLGEIKEFFIYGGLYILLCIILFVKINIIDRAIIVWIMGKIPWKLFGKCG